MISHEHKKHPELVKPSLGNFGRNEWAIMGTTCPAIKELSHEIISNLSIQYKCAYIDAAHAKENEEVILPGRLSAGAVAEYSDRINYHDIALHQSLNPFQFRQLFGNADFILVNGNHQQAKSQVIVLDRVKEASLRKKVNRFTDVQLFLLTDGVDEIFDFVKEALPGWEKIPVFKWDERDKIISFFAEKMNTSVSKLNGLVLAGGKSIRFGTDKGKINWEGKELRYHLAELLQSFCEQVYISCRPEQQNEIEPRFETLPDTFTGLGPYGAILSAFRKQPDCAWLVIACDLPLLDETTIRCLTDQRKSSSVGTAFESPHDGMPEPLIAIWEPKSYPVLLSFLSQGYSCPRKVLMNSESTIIKAPKAEALLNVNTRDEFDKAKKLSGEKTKSTTVIHGINS